MVRVKICGITNYEDAYAACGYGADAIGFVFAKSPRQVAPSVVKSIIEKLPPYIVTVGVFVNEDKKEVLKIAKDCKLTCLQFHGEEGHEYCSDFRKGHRIIKAIRVRDEKSLFRLNEYDVDAFLLDAFVEGRRGGIGLKFDWDLAIEAKGYGKPIILAGGIGIENVEEAVRKVAPYAIDASSAVEYAPGKKDHNLMKILIEKVRNLKKLEGKRYVIKQ